jgi:hypothetical protein
MSNISIENLSYDSKMDAQAMDALTGGWFGSFVKRIKRAVCRINPRSVSKYLRCAVRRRIRRWF